MDRRIKWAPQPKSAARVSSSIANNRTVKVVLSVLTMSPVYTAEYLPWSSSTR